MKASVIRAYTDRLTGEIHLEGDIVELTSERAEELAAGGFVVVTSKATPKEAAPSATGDEPKEAPRKRTTRKASR